MYRYNRRSMSSEMLRDLYESWLILATGMLVRWNRWRPLINATLVSPLDPIPHTIGDNERWADVYFECGLLLAILQYRPIWVRRCRHPVHLLMLLSELMLLLQLVYWIDCQSWQSFLGIFRDLFLAMGHGQWGSSFIRLPAGVSSLLLDGYVYDVFRLLISFVFFAFALSSAAGEWRMTLDFLLIGCLPKTSARWQCLTVDYKKRDFQRRCRGLPPNPPPELLIYRRMCSLCLQQLESAAPIPPETRLEQRHSYLSILFTAANAFK